MNIKLLELIGPIMLSIPFLAMGIYGFINTNTRKEGFILLGGTLVFIAWIVWDLLR